MIENVSAILSRCSTAGTNISPTILYNEGWMTRLLVEVSIDAQLKLADIDFDNIGYWYSEGLLSSPFLARSRQDNLAEGYTHADMALGDFRVDSANRGDITIEGASGVFGVIEAKMGSQLSAGTKNAVEYDQASRNLACIAFNTLSTEYRIFFGVVAPRKKIEENEMDLQVSVSRMVEKIARRFDMYDVDSEVHALKERVLDRAQRCSCFVISYESWIDALANHNAHADLEDFKNQCYRFNRIG